MIGRFEAWSLASFLLAVGRQSAELFFGGSPLGSPGGGIPARPGRSWSTGGGGEFIPPTELLWHKSKTEEAKSGGYN
jgi:hypothetical protein